MCVLGGCVSSSCILNSYFCSNSRYCSHSTRSTSNISTVQSWHSAIRVGVGKRGGGGLCIVHPPLQVSFTPTGACCATVHIAFPATSTSIHVLTFLPSLHIHCSCLRLCFFVFFLLLMLFSLSLSLALSAYCSAKCRSG